MQNFNFYNPTNILFGKGMLEELNAKVPMNANVLLTYGGGSVKRFGTLDKVKSQLNGRTVFEFGGIEPNPQYDTLMKAVKMVKDNNIDFIIAIGGGSVIDGTKFINLAANYNKSNAEELLGYGFDNVPVKGVLPFGVVLTLPATGSEMNSSAVISKGESKFPVYSSLAFPVFSILDPELTFTLPKKQVANGIVDAFIHVVEQYITYPVDARFQDRTAEGIMQTLIEVSDETLQNNENYDARANLMLCATMALNGLIGSGVPQDWSTHLIGHELTGLFGIDHGRSLCIVLPALWEVRKNKKKDKLLQYANRVWGINSGTDEERIDEVIKTTREFFEGLGIKTRLSDYGLKEADIDKVIKALDTHGMTNLSETGDLTLDIAREILMLAL